MFNPGESRRIRFVDVLNPRQHKGRIHQQRISLWVHHSRNTTVFAGLHIGYLMHPLVRDLYKRAILVGHDYPLGLDYVRTTWKKAIRNPQNCPSCYSIDNNNNDDDYRIANLEHLRLSEECEREIRKAVGKGRFYIREMVGVIQFKKYRAMKKRYDNNQVDPELQARLKSIIEKATPL